MISSAMTLKYGWVSEQSTVFEEAKGIYDYSNTFCHVRYVLNHIIRFLTSMKTESACLPNANEDQKDLESVVFV